LNNVVMDLDRLVRTDGACEKKKRHRLPMHVSRYNYVNGHAREYLRGRAEEEHRRTIRKKRLPQHAPDHANCFRTME